MVDFDAAHPAVHYPPDRRFSGSDQAVAVVAGAGGLGGHSSGDRLDRDECLGSAEHRAVADVNPNNVAFAARISGVGSVLPLLQLPVRDAADPQRAVDSRGSPAAVLQRRLHAWKRMDQVHADRRFRMTGSGRPKMTRATSRRSWRRQATGTRSASRERGTSSTSTASSRPVSCSRHCSSRPTNGGVSCRRRRSCSAQAWNDLGALRHLSLTARAERVLRLQRAAADRVLRGVLGVRADRDPDRHRDVACGRESVSPLRPTVRRQADPRARFTS